MRWRQIPAELRWRRILVKSDDVESCKVRFVQRRSKYQSAEGRNLIRSGVNTPRGRHSNLHPGLRHRATNDLISVDRRHPRGTMFVDIRAFGGIRPEIRSLRTSEGNFYCARHPGIQAIEHKDIICWWGFQKAWPHRMETDIGFQYRVLHMLRILLD